jgi:DNA-binding NtrC family response regulator
MNEGKRAILCVDDETIILLSLIQELKSSFGNEYVYEKATDADQAYSVIEELVQDGIKLILIISDWLMPGIKGDEFLETVRNRYPGINAIMITGQADKDVIDRLLASGCVMDVIEKPWNPQRLIEAVRRCAISGDETA